MYSWEDQGNPQNSSSKGKKVVVATSSSSLGPKSEGNSMPSVEVRGSSSSVGMTEIQ